MLSDMKGFMYNGVLACDEPLKYDEHLGKIGALCYELFSSTDNPEGATYLDENRTVCFRLLLKFCVSDCTQ